MSIGRIEHFNVREDNWKLYVDRLEQYFVVNKIEENLQVPTLITVIGAEGYELLVNLCTPDEPKQKKFKEIKEVMGRHLQPKPSVLAERYKFRHRKQNQGEGIAEYVAVLKRMSKSCEFGSWLTESLRDQLVCGIISDVIRQRLFAEQELDFIKAYNLAVSMEAAEKDAAIVNSTLTSVASVSVRDIETAQCYAVSNVRSGRGGSVRTAAAATRPAGGYGRGGAGVRAAHEPAGEGGAVGPVRPPADPTRARARRLCGACGGHHEGGTCKFARYICRVCNRQGHLKRMCPYLTEQYCVEVTTEDQVSKRRQIVNINQFTLSECKPVKITLNVQGENIDMECDTGSAISCISYDSYKKLFPHLPIEPCTLLLRYYTGEIVRPVGVIRPLVKYKDKEKCLDLHVIKNGKTILVGRQWMAELGLQIPSIGYGSVNNINNDNFDMSDFTRRYCDVFAEGLGRFTGGPVRIHVREGAQPVFLRARPLAYALRAPVERALDQLVRDGVLTPVDRSDWATPIVPVIKKDGSIRICADFKLTLNKVLEVDRHPLPRIDDLLTRLHGGESFSKIDLAQAYAQFELDETKKVTVINTHKGLFMYNRLIYGLASSPGIFQKRLEQLFADLPHVGVFLDDIIITGSTSQDHLSNLHKVFSRLQSHGLRVRKDKCEFFKKSVNYLGHVISKDGVSTCPDKVKAVIDTPPPTNVSEVRSFVGMVMYYSKFIKNTSTILAPLYNLLKLHSKFHWDTACHEAFIKIKKLLASSTVLMHYTPELPLVLTTDASGVGVSAILSQLTLEGERPVAYASRSLTSAEKGYAQIDREALAIVFGVKKYHQYLYGRKFILRTDHKPLTHIFSPKAGIPIMAAARMQRWAVLLAGYNYDIEYVTSNRNCADALSRLPCEEQRKREGMEEISYVNFVENFLPITNDDVRKATEKDPVLNRILFFLHSNWPSPCEKNELKPFYNRRTELYIDRGCVMWGYRIVIPESLQKQVLKQLHSSHMGIVKMKTLARSYVYWPNIDADIESICKQCETCAAEAQAPPRAPPQPWPYLVQPWSRVHVDFLGPFLNKMYLVMIDSSSKWLEIFEMSRTTATCVIKILRATFARFGLPLEVVSDQGPPFTSNEFSMFLKQNGIRQSFSPAYHPASNGAAENAVKLCKRTIKKAVRDRIDIDAALQNFLLNYRNTIHSTTGETPANLLQKRTLRSRLDLLRGDRIVEERVNERQRRQVEYAGGVAREFTEGDTVWSKTHGGPNKWEKGIIKSVEGTRRYIIDSGDGRPTKKHIDQLRRRSFLTNVPCPDTRDDAHREVGGGSEYTGATEMVSDEKEVPTSPTMPTVAVSGPSTVPNMGPGVEVDTSRHPTPDPSPAQPRQSKRIRKPVVRYKIEID